MTIWAPDLTEFPGPRYRAIAAAIARDVTAGRLAAGERLPTHRHLADRLGVTVGTVSRGYAEAERRGLVAGRVGSGTYVRNAGEDTGHRNFAITAPAAADAIDFGLSLPVPARTEALLSDFLRKLAADRDALADIVTYPPETGLARHRHTLAEWLTAWGTPIDPDELVLTIGGQHAIHLALRVLARPGETVAAASLTYPGLIGAAQQAHIALHPLPMDADGIRPEDFAAACEQRSIRALYCMPNQNNPTTVCMTLERRQELIEVARRRGVMLIEDEVHLVDQAERPPNLVQLAPDQVLYISSCSKTLAGGLRIGLLRAPGFLLARLRDALRWNCWTPPPITAELACRVIESGQARALADWQRGEIGARQALATEILADYPIAAQPYGFNVWLPLPEPWRADAFVRACAAEGVGVKSAEPFAVGRVPAPQAIRLALSVPAAREQVDAGLRIVRRLLDAVPTGPGSTI